MNPETGYEDWLDRVLRDSARDYIPDQGFTARVVAALPAVRRPWYARRETILLVFGVVAGAVALLIPASMDYLARSLVDIFTLRSLSADRLAALVPIALLYWAGLSAAVSER
jgi:hypothetical protein